jgi:hypothetical protein
MLISKRGMFHALHSLRTGLDASRKDKTEPHVTWLGSGFFQGNQTDEESALPAS